MSFKSLKIEVIEPDLCCRCGTCAAICPADNIAFNDRQGKCLPEDQGHCREHCTLCVKVCPGLLSEGAGLHESPPKGPHDCPGLGQYEEICLLKSVDPLVRRQGTSGGAVTAILVWALEQGAVDAVLSVGPDPNNPLATAARISSRWEELLECGQSRYCVVPINEALKTLAPDKKYAVVGLPCHIEGLKKLLRIKPKMENRIALILGLFCHSTIYYEATRRLLELAPETAQSLPTGIKYRDGEFPGGFKAYWSDHSQSIAPLDDLMVYFDVYALNRCRLCLNHVNHYADLSFADPFPFLNELPETDRKWTAAIVRNDRGKTILEKLLQSGGAMQRKEVSEKNILAWENKWKAKNWVHLLQLASDKQLGKPIPEMGGALPEIGFTRAVLNTAKNKFFHDINLGSTKMVMRIFAMDERARALKRLKNGHAGTRNRPPEVRNEDNGRANT